jgi:phosphotransferase system HPr (HPr) family protein
MSPSSEPTAATAPATAPAESAVRTVIIPVDLHARPAGLLVRTAAGFTAAVTVSTGERSANARSVLEVMGLGATAGTAVTVRADGMDAEAAVLALTAVLGTAEP